MDAEERFWQLAAPVLKDGRVTRPNMMGLPCLRAGGEYFAALEHNSGRLAVKLPAARVAHLVVPGTTRP